MNLLTNRISIVLLFFSSLSFAQEKTWTLHECMQYAVENSLQKKMQEEQNKIYHQNYVQAVGNLLPSIGASTSASFNFGRGLNAETNMYADVNAFNNNYDVYAGLTLFNGLASINRLKIEKMSKLYGKQKLQETKDLIAYETMELFFNVLYYKELTDLAQEQLEESRKNLEQIRRMEELGVKSFPDVSEMSAKEASDNYNLTRQENLLRMAVIQLKGKMNFPLDEDLTIAGYDSDDLIVKTNDSSIAVYEASQHFLPKALMAETMVESSRLSYKTAKGNLFPTISVEAGLGTNFYRLMDGGEYISFSEQFRNKRGYYVGFTLSIPVFDRFSRSTQLKKAKSQVIISQYEKEMTLRTIYSEIEQAVTDMNGQVDEYYQAQKQVDAMSVAHQVNERKYKEGLIGAMDLHTSSNRLLQAKVEKLNAKLKFYLKQRLVNYYKGESFIHE